MSHLLHSPLTLHGMTRHTPPARDLTLTCGPLRNILLSTNQPQVSPAHGRQGPEIGDAQTPTGCIECRSRRSADIPGPGTRLSQRTFLQQEQDRAWELGRPDELDACITLGRLREPRPGTVDSHRHLRRASETESSRPGRSYAPSSLFQGEPAAATCWPPRLAQPAAFSSSVAVDSAQSAVVVAVVRRAWLWAVAVGGWHVPGDWGFLVFCVCRLLLLHRRRLLVVGALQEINPP